MSGCGGGASSSDSSGDTGGGGASDGATGGSAPRAAGGSGGVGAAGGSLAGASGKGGAGGKGGAAAGGSGGLGGSNGGSDSGAPASGGAGASASAGAAASGAGGASAGGGTGGASAGGSSSGKGGSPSSTSGGQGGGQGGGDGGTAGGGAAGSGGSAAAGSGGTSAAPCGGGCPVGYTCGTANGLEVCRAPSGVPMFTSVTLIMMENTSLSSLQAAMDGGSAPHLKALASGHATGSDYHGVDHPSLPNYIALTSGDTQGIGCDCKAAAGQGSCNLLTCSRLFGACSCSQPAENIADQLEAVGVPWMAFAEDMGPPCNLADAGKYAARHVPFLYYDGIQKDAARCNKHVLDLKGFDPGAATGFSFIAPNLTNDMHDPFPSDSTNIPNGDAWLGPRVDDILGSAPYQKGGLLVVLWDEDDNSGGLTGNDDPVGLFVLSPYARSGGFQSTLKADHYSLLATIEDGFNTPRLGNAGMSRPGYADTLADFFPGN